MWPFLFFKPFRYGGIIYRFIDDSTKERENVEVYMLWMNFQRFFDDFFFKDSSLETENIAEKRKEREKVAHSPKKARNYHI